jgi:hypothetical protein
MSTAWMIYWWTRLDSINCFFGMAMFVSLAIAFMLWLEDSDSRLLPHCMVAAACIGFISIWIPSSKDVALIVGGQLATDVVQTPEAKELGTKALQLINQELDSRIKSNPSKSEVTNE